MTPQGSELDTGVSPNSQETNHNYPPALRPGKVYTISSRCVVMLIARYGPPLNPVLGPGGLVWTVCQRYRHQVGPHPVRDAWNDAELSSVAIEHCSAVGVKWGFIGLCRLGYREEDAPVTVLISLMDPMVRKPTAAVVEKHERVTHAIHGDLVRQYVVPLSCQMLGI